LFVVEVGADKRLTLVVGWQQIIQIECLNREAQGPSKTSTTEFLAAHINLYQHGQSSSVTFCCESQTSSVNTKLTVWFKTRTRRWLQESRIEEPGVQGHLALSKLTRYTKSYLCSMMTSSGFCLVRSTTICHQTDLVNNTMSIRGCPLCSNR
jgi:hypothetical protein